MKLLHASLGTHLRLDLTHSKVSIEDLNEEWAKQFIGGNRIIF